MTIKIHGKDYVTVNERIQMFWKDHQADGKIMTKMISNEGEVGKRNCVFQAGIYVGEILRSSGYAQEAETSRGVNATSYVENCETSAIGRALGIFGIGILDSVASADEVVTAIQGQSSGDVEFGPDSTDLTPPEVEQGAQGATPHKYHDHISDPLRKRFYAICKGANLPDDYVKEYMKTKYDIDTSYNIEKIYYDDICKWAEGHKNKS